jgi:3-hydroxyacyl-CoA dehydrogenase
VREAQTAATPPDRCCPAAIGHHRIELFGPDDERSAKDCRYPERCVIGHPSNPPHLVPLVEVVAGAQTAPVAVERALTIYTALGKRPILIRREVKGHVANRLQAALWREAVHLLAEGVANVADIDTAVSEGPGLRWALMGPHLTFHLAGGTGGISHFLDQFAGPMEGWWQDLGRPELTTAVREKIVFRRPG